MVPPIPQKFAIHPWPKMIFLYPTALMSGFMYFASLWSADWQHVWGGAFLVVFGVNLLVLTFDFPRATSLTFAIGLVAVVLLLLLINHNIEIIPPLKSFIANRNIYASSEFYGVFFLINVLLFLGMFATTRFDYWELTSNEIVHYHGILGDTERFSTSGLKLNKEIADIFEYVLCGAGRIILQIPNVPRPIVLENVPNINRVERMAYHMLEARVVRFETPSVEHQDDSVSVKEADF